MREWMIVVLAAYLDGKIDEDAYIEIQAQLRRKMFRVV